ncbi:multidrug and toxin extrusion protein 1 [Osmerus eperlanus]|uniref:multidrug and toxin extrusion protein 1 n=1 Tax=Osmerus eperlanus TaxID=29151 RepID=UPI002E0E9DAD
MEKSGVSEPTGPLLGAGQVAVGAVGRSAGAEGEDGEVAAVSSKLFCCACLRRWIPLAYREELYHVLRLTGPLLVSRILNLLLPFVITIFCGHLGNAELAGYALASTIIGVTTTATGYGLSLACDTLISQTFGSKNLKRVGVILQRGVLILLLFCLPCWALLINTNNLLLLLKQEEEVARVAHLYVTAFLPAVPAMFLHQLQSSYLQSQGIILPQMYTAAIANVINVGVNYVLIFNLEMGVLGSAIANSLSQIYICLLLYAYICWRGLHRNTWGGWSTDSLQEWGSYMQLAIPSTLMVCFEWWVWEIGSFLAGILGEVDLAAQHVFMELAALTYMFPLGVHAATCVRVGNALGAGDTSSAIITCKVALALSGLLALFQGVGIFGSKSVLGCIFTSDQNIVELVSKNLTLYTFTQFFDAIVCVCTGILVGAGKQKIAALTNLVTYYCIGLPVGTALMFAAKLRIIGFWGGLSICIVIQMTFFIILIFKLNWQKVTEEAQVRAGKGRPVTIVPSKAPIGHPVIDTLIPEGSEYPRPTFNSDMIQSDNEALKAAGHTPVSTQEQGTGEKQGLRAGGISKGPGVCAGEAEGGGVAPESQTETELSMSQLVLRRGLTLLVLLVILATGVAVHLACPPPKPSIQSRSNLTLLDWANYSSTPTPAPWLDLTLPHLTL